MSSIATPSRRRRHTLLGAVLALVATPAVMSPAEAATCTMPCVLVKVTTTTGGEERVVRTYPVRLDDRDSYVDLTGKQYKIRAKPGRPAKPLDGPISLPTSLEDIYTEALQDTGSGSRTGKFSETRAKGRFPSVLGADEFGDGFANGLLPIVYVDGQSIGYVRPLRAGGKDVNVGDAFTTAPRQPLVVHLHTTGRVLEVDVTATPKKVTTGTTVAFSAKVSPQQDGLAYAWNFTGGTSSKDERASPTHRYTKRGTYAVNVAVRGRDGSFGQASTTTVKVGKKPKPPKTGSGGGGTGSGGSTGGGTGPGYVPPYNPTTPPYDPMNPDTPPADDPPPMDDVAPLDGLEEVEGFVLAGAGADQGDSIPGTEAPTAATAASDLSTSRKISAGAIGAMAVLLLMGLGAEIETRWLSTRLGHLRRRA